MTGKIGPHPGLTPEEQAVDGHVYDLEAFDNDGTFTLYGHQKDAMERLMMLPPGSMTGRVSGKLEPAGSPYSFAGMQYRKPRNKIGELHFGYGGTLKQWMRQGRQYPAHWVDDVFDRRAKKMLAYYRNDMMIAAFFADYGDIELRVVLTYLYGYPVATPKHRLRAPYGRDNGGMSGNAVTLVWQGQDGDWRESPWPTREEADMIGGLCVGFGCMAWIAKRVADCMYASGRYDCVMTVSINVIDTNMTSCMEQLRVNVHRTDPPRPGERR